MSDLPKVRKNIGMCAGPLVLSAFMSHIKQEGQGFDFNQTIFCPGENGFPASTVLHSFDGRYGDSKRIVVFENAVTMCLPEWTAKTRFATDQVFPTSLGELGEIVVSANQWDVMFAAAGSKIVVGPFFEEESSLRKKFSDVLADTNIQYSELTQRGADLWEVIYKNGGLPELCRIWDELMHKKVYPRLCEVTRFKMHIAG